MIYATSGWGVHDERWATGLRTLGFPTTVMSLGREVSSTTELRAALEQSLAKDPQTAVLAGPLDSITAALGGLPHLIGLSWGFDLVRPTNEVVELLPTLAGLIVDSEINRSTVIAAGLAEERVTVLPWGVDLETFTPRGERLNPATLKLDPHARILLSLRAHEEIYRIRDIVDAFAMIAESHPDIALVIGHGGSLTAQLKEHVATLGLTDNVRFVGRLAESELPKLMRSSTLYVSASSVDGTSVTLMQAMACELPCIVSDIPQNTAWIEDMSTGFTFRTGDAHHLAEVLTHALNSPDALPRAAPRQRVVADANWSTNLPRLAAALHKA